MGISKLTIIKVKQPRLETLNEKLLFLGGSLGLFNTRDKDKSCFRIFVKLLTDKELTSDDLASSLNLSRGTVVHHLHRLADAGIVIYKYNKYKLSTDTLKMMLDNIKKDINEFLDHLKKIAENIDNKIEHL